MGWTEAIKILFSKSFKSEYNSLQKEIKTAETALAKLEVNSPEFWSHINSREIGSYAWKITRQYRIQQATQEEYCRRDNMLKKYVEMHTAKIANQDC